MEINTTNTRANTPKAANFKRSIIEHREKVLTLKNKLRPAKVSYKDILVSLNKNTIIPTRLYNPNNTKIPQPTVFYFPGTAFIARERAFTDVCCSNIAVQSGFQVILIHHLLAPENQFPEGLNSAYHLLKFFINSQSLVYVDKDRVVLMGYGSGRNFAASIAIKAKKDGIKIAYQVLVSPLLDLSRKKNKESHFEDKDKTIPAAFVNWFLNLYVPKHYNRKDPLLSPLWHKISELIGLPDTHIVFGEHDRFRGDAFRYIEKLIKAGVETSGQMIKGENHIFWWNRVDIMRELGSLIKKTIAFRSLPKLQKPCIHSTEKQPPQYHPSSLFTPSTIATDDNTYIPLSVKPCNAYQPKAKL